MTDLGALTRGDGAPRPAARRARPRRAARANAADLVRRAGGTPVRVASKSVRCRCGARPRRWRRPGFAGVMAYSLREAIWLGAAGVRDVLVGYPTRRPRRAAPSWRADPDAAASAITLMVDDVEQLDLIRAAPARRCGCCLDVDASLRIGPAAPRRAALAAAHAGATAAALAGRGRRAVGLAGRRRDVLRGADRRAAGHARRPSGCVKRALGGASWRDAAAAVVERGRDGRRRARARQLRRHRQPRGELGRPGRHRGDRRVGPLRARPCSTATAPSRRGRRCSSRCRWCAARRRGIATLFGGGYIASGPAGQVAAARRRPAAGCSCCGTEGAGEVQTPVRGAGRGGLRVGRPGLVPARQGRRAAASGSTRCTWSTARRSSDPCRPTAARGRTSADPLGRTRAYAVRTASTSRISACTAGSAISPSGPTASRGDRDAAARPLDDLGLDVAEHGAQGVVRARRRAAGRRPTFTQATGLPVDLASPPTVQSSRFLNEPGSVPAYSGVQNSTASAPAIGRAQPGDRLGAAARGRRRG